jgi:mannose-1-phosphate guanylyltransferase
MSVEHVWALVLAGGEGSRLRSLTTQPCGTAVPKQFCSLYGGRSLLGDAIHRAARLIEPARICAIVGQQHQRWWAESDELRRLPPRNLIVQPSNRGTGVGILYAILHILGWDPEAHVVILPSDHYVRDEGMLGEALRTALRRVEENDAPPVLLGMEPDSIDAELGYIVPAEPHAAGGQRVAQFIEKPTLAEARRLVEQGAVWTAFIVAARAQTLLELFLSRYAPLVVEMQVLLTRQQRLGTPAGGWPALVDLYRRLPTLDFSKDILADQVPRLCVIRVAQCGWTDLGTPRRVAEVLERLPESQAAERMAPAAIDLAAQVQRAASRSIALS